MKKKRKRNAQQHQTCLTRLLRRSPPLRSSPPPPPPPTHTHTMRRSFISRVRPTVHTNSPRKRRAFSFWKRSSNWRNFKMPALRSSVDGNNLEQKIFENNDVTIITCFPCSSLSRTPIQNGLNVSGVVWTGPGCISTDTILSTSN